MNSLDHIVLRVLLGLWAYGVFLHPFVCKRIK